MQPVLEAVARYVSDNNFGEVVLKHDLLPKSCPLAVKTEGALAFFRTTNSERLVSDWRQAQTEIARLPGEPTPVRSLYLTLLVTDSIATQPAWQEVVRDLHVCRKLVVATAGEAVDDWLDELPFIPIPEQYIRPHRVITPVQALFAADFAPSLAEALLGRVGQDAIARRFLEGRVRRTEHMKQPDLHDLPTKVPGRRLERLELENFRPFGGVHHVDLSGDLTVIYGPNGAGKSTLTQAIEWGITGSVDYLEEPHDDIRSVRSVSPYVNVRNLDQPAVVRITFQDDWGARHRLERSVDRDNRSRRLWGALTSRPNGQEIWSSQSTGPGDLLRMVLNASLPRSLSAATLRAMARGAHFLDQSTIRMFLSTSATERFRAMASMAGTADFERATRKLSGVVQSLEIERTEAQMNVDARKNEYRTAEALAEQVQAKVTQVESAVPDLGGTELASEALRLAGELDLPLPSALQADASGLISLAGLLQGAVESKGRALRERVRAFDRLLEGLGELSETQEKARAARAERQALAPQLRTLTEQFEQAKSQTRGSATAHTSALELWVELDPTARVAQRNLHAARELQEAGTLMLQAREARRVAIQVFTNLATVVSELQDTARLAHAQRDSLDTRQRQLARRRGALAELRESQPAFREAVIGLRRNQVEQQSYELQRQQLRDQLGNVTGRLSSAHKEQEEARALLERLSTRAQERQRLLTALAGYLEGASCPLCGHDWETATKLHSQVQDAQRDTPEELTLAQRRLHAATQRAEELRQTLDGAAAQLVRLEHTMEVARKQEQTARQTIALWLADAASFGAVPTPHQDATGPWLDGLEQAAAEEDRAAELAEAEREAQKASDAVRPAAEAVAAQRAEVERWSLASEEAERHYRAVDSQAPTDITRPVPGAADLSRLEAMAQQAGTRLAEASAAVHQSKEKLEADRSAESTVAGAWHELYDRDTRLAGEVEAATRLSNVHQAMAAELGVKSEEAAIMAARDTAHRQTDLARRLQELARMLLSAADLQTLRAGFATAERERDEKRVAVEAALEAVRQVVRAVRAAREAVDALERARIAEQQRRLNVYQPTINEVYRRINPHPYFSHLNLRTDVAKGQMVLHAAEPGSNLALPVQQYFSMAQENVVALSIFLGTALLQTWSGLKLISIDDPIQQMDDLNTTAFLDVLHAVVRRGHQVVVTTANKDFYRLMLRRYAYLNVSAAGRFRAYRLRSVNVVAGPSLADDTPVVLTDGRVRLGEALVAH